MKTETSESGQRHWRWLRFVLEKSLPLGVRKEYLDALDENRGPALEFAVESAASVAGIQKCNRERTGKRILFRRLRIGHE